MPAPGPVYAPESEPAHELVYGPAHEPGPGPALQASPASLPESPPEALPPAHNHLLPRHRCPRPLRPPDNPPPEGLCSPHRHRRQSHPHTPGIHRIRQSPGIHPHRHIPDNPLNSPKAQAPLPFPSCCFCPGFPADRPSCHPVHPCCRPFSRSPW